MTSKLEEVARAIDPLKWQRFDQDNWNKCRSDEEIRDLKRVSGLVLPSLKRALAAIEAMREPNDAMRMAGGEAILNADEEWKSNACYRAMIGAALREEGR